MDLHNFLLRGYYHTATVDIESTRDEWLAMADRVKPMIVDTAGYLEDLRRSGANLLFEGAQGTLLDIDQGTYPYVTSSNTTAGAAATGTGLGPGGFDYVLGVVKAYATRVGAGPFPTELFDEPGKHLASVGVEFGATTGRPRRCGWLDTVVLKRAVLNNGVTGLCVTKLDVLDELAEIKICVAYEHAGARSGDPPLLADDYAACQPVYEELPGWQASTVDRTAFEKLPGAAQTYLRRLEEILGVPIDIISTGPDRDQNILIRHPFD
jgi:adenylosuccinate synthase